MGHTAHSYYTYYRTYNTELFLFCAAVVEIGFTQQEYSIDEIDGQVLICIELLNPVHLSSPIEMRVETEDQTALGISMIMHNKDCS